MSVKVDCSFCKPKKMDWEESGFYGYRCKECQGPTAFIVSKEHRGNLNAEEKELVSNLCKKHYPDLKVRWLSESRKNMLHFYDFLVPLK